MSKKKYFTFDNEQVLKVYRERLGKDMIVITDKGAWNAIYDPSVNTMGLVKFYEVNDETLEGNKVYY